LNYWIFKINPDQYRLDDRLRDPNPILTCPVTRYHDRIQKGDTVFLWRANPPRGICAIMMIEECPFTPTASDLNDGYELPPGSVVPGPDHWARVRLVQRFPVVEAGIVKKIQGLELFSFFSAFQQAVNYSITRPEGAILLEFIEKYQQEEHKPAPTPRAKPRKAAPARTTSPKKPTGGPSDFALLKCEDCGRYVVNSEAERHVREVHDGLAVEWKKMK
jgi:predicted RNA-binding protein with PUA-like domain